MSSIEKEIENFEYICKVLLTTNIDLTELLIDPKKKKVDFLKTINFTIDKLEDLRQYFKYKIKKMEADR